MDKKEILKNFKNQGLYNDDFNIINSMQDNQLQFLYDTTIKYGELAFSILMSLKYNEKSFDELEAKAKYYYDYRMKDKIETIKLKKVEKQPEKKQPEQSRLSTPPKQDLVTTKKNNNQDPSILTPIIEDLCKILGIPSVIGRPNDMAEFMMPTKDMNEKNKICLYDFWEYLFSSSRNMFLQGVAYQMPYYIEKCSGMNNKHKALARLESILFNFKVPSFEYFLSHNFYENGECSPVEPDTLFNVKFDDIINNPKNELNAYLIGMFEKLCFAKDNLIDEKLNLHSKKSTDQKA